MNVQVKNSYRSKIKRRLSDHGKKSLFASEIGITRMTLWRLLSTGCVRKNTLEAVVKYFEGENADPEKYIVKP